MTLTEAEKGEYHRLTGRPLDAYMRAYGHEWYKGARPENERAAHEAGIAAARKEGKGT